MIVGCSSPLWNGALWESCDSFGVNAIGEPCDRKGHARFDGEALVLGDVYGCALYAPGGNHRDQLARLRIVRPVPVPYPTRQYDTYTHPGVSLPYVSLHDSFGFFTLPIGKNPY